MSLAQTQTKVSEAEHISLAVHARQQKTAQEEPCASYRVKKQTVLATPNPLRAEQAESVSSNKKGHQQREGRTTWWSPLANLAAKLVFSVTNCCQSRLCSSKLTPNGANCPDTTCQRSKARLA